MPEETIDNPQTKPGRTFTYRAVIIGVFATILMAMWIHFHEVLVPRPNILAENSPPASAVGMLIGILIVGTIVTALKSKLRLRAGELVVIYTMLVTSAPLMSQGMWHRFLGFVVAIPDAKHNMPLVDSFSEKLWPHGRQLIQYPHFTGGKDAEWTVTPGRNHRLVKADDTPAGPASAIELLNVLPEGADVTPDSLKTTLRLRVPRYRNNREILIPGERYYFNALFRLSDMRSTSRLSIELETAAGETVPLLVLHRDTVLNFSNKGRFERRGEPYVSLPRQTGDYIDLRFTMQGTGRAAITDINFFSNEALARLLKGSTEISESDLPQVPANERNSLLVRPDSLTSPRGILYVIRGYIPWRQWIVPLAYWASIVAAIFLCLMAIGVIFRRQWADKERFPFPMIVIPRLLIEEKEEDGRVFRPIFHKRSFRIGVALAFLYCLWQGLAHYVPGFPDPTVNVPLADYVSSPGGKAFFSRVDFNIKLMFLAIAFFVDVEMLLSILVFFFLARIPHYLGEVFGWKAIQGPRDDFPFWHEQHIGAFLGLVIVVLWISRKHLAAVGRTVFNRPGKLDDSNEAMSYRSAFILIVLCIIFFAVWGEMTALGAGPALLFFGFLVVCGISAARIRTEMGAPFTYFTPYFPYLIFFLLGGLTVFGTETMVLAYLAGGFMAVAQFLLFAPTQVEMFHLGNQFNAKPKGISKGLVLGLLGGVLVGGYVMLVWAYGVGGQNIHYMKVWALRQDWYLTTLRQSVASTNAAVASAAAQGVEVSTEYPAAPLTAVGIGTGVTVLLTALRTRFVGFWLHPIGYVLANTFFILACWGSLLTAWVIKMLTLKIGGPRAVREVMTPLMVGVFCGAIGGIVFWDLIGFLLMVQGASDIFTCFP